VALEEEMIDYQEISNQLRQQL